MNDNQSKVMLRPMDSTEFKSFRTNADKEYARENIESGRWPEGNALERAEKETDRLLPDGLETEGNHLFQIVDIETDSSVGCLWLALTNQYDTVDAFIYDIEIAEKYRRKGYGRETIKAAEIFSLEKGASSLALNVFSQNKSAQALYYASGYNVTNFNMRKNLS